MPACQPSPEMETSAPGLVEPLLPSARSPSPPISTVHESTHVLARPTSPLSAWPDAYVNNDGDVSMEAGPSRPATSPCLASARMEAKLTPMQSSPFPRPALSGTLLSPLTTLRWAPYLRPRRGARGSRPAALAQPRGSVGSRTRTRTQTLWPRRRARSKSCSRKVSDVPADVPPSRAGSPCTLPTNRPYPTLGEPALGGAWSSSCGLHPCHARGFVALFMNVFSVLPC
jgi:hypothetical protein